MSSWNQSVKFTLSFLITLCCCFISCKNDPDEEITPQTSTFIPPLTDSLFTITYDSTYLYAVIAYYPGFGNWDTTIHFPFDIDGDNQADFYFRSFAEATWLGGSTPYYTSETFSIEGDSLNQFTKGIGSGIDVFSVGSLISDSLYFANYGYLEVYVPSISINNWPLINQSQYVGIKLIRNGNTHYGWMEIQKLPAGYMKLVKIVYDLIPGSPVIIN